MILARSSRHREKHGCPGVMHVEQGDLEAGKEARGRVMSCKTQGDHILRCIMSSPDDFLMRALSGLNPGLGLVPQISRILSGVNSSRKRHPKTGLTQCRADVRKPREQKRLQ